MMPKFRAWVKQQKKILPVNDLTLNGLDNEPVGVNSCGDLMCTTCIDWFRFEDIELMQSTGLKDKNGVEIFEGDIVHVLDSEQINQRDENGAYIDAFFEEIDEIDSVVFVDGCFKLKRTGFDVCICKSVEDFKIIGNIYENPELLEVE